MLPTALRISRTPLNRPVCRCRAVLILFVAMIVDDRDSRSAEPGPAEGAPAAEAFDRFDRTIVHEGAASVHVESRRRRPLPTEGEAKYEGAAEVVEVRFTHGVFENLVFGPKDDEAACIRDLEQALDFRVKHLAWIFDLGAAQQKKLMLAGRGDIAQVRDEIQVLKARFAEPGFIEDDSLHAIRNWSLDFIKEATALRSRAMGRDIFSKGSKLDKVLRRQLTPAQVAELETRQEFLPRPARGKERLNPQENGRHGFRVLIERNSNPPAGGGK